MDILHLHLVSDSTGETLDMIARAVCVRFEVVRPVEHIYALTRSREQIEYILTQIDARPGIVMSTLVDDDLRAFLEDQCQKRNIPCLAVLDQIAEKISDYLGVKLAKRPPGGQHMMDAAYFQRISALSYAMSHDDGQQVETLDEADIILLGVSRTSKTPTCFYLAHRGIKAANVPIVPGIDLPPFLDKLVHPLIIGLSLTPSTLVQIRRKRFGHDVAMPQHSQSSAYTDPAQVVQEITYANRLFARQNWPIIDVTNRSVEETAAAILNLKREADEAEK